MEEELGLEVLKYVGGVDISFSKKDPSLACGTLVVLDFHTLQVVYEDFSVVTLNVPYVPGFLAFREVLVLFVLLVLTATFQYFFLFVLGSVWLLGKWKKRKLVVICVFGFFSLWESS